MAISINDWQLLETENKLLRGDQEVMLQPLCAKLLAFLATRSGQVVSREQLVAQVWQGRVVSEDAINNCIKKIRKALNDDPKQPQMIQTIPKQGYRLINHKALDKSRPFTNKFRLPLIICALLGCLYTSYAFLPISMEVIQISQDMSEEEKQRRYQQVMERTQNGGHIIKLDVGKSIADSSKSG